MPSQDKGQEKQDAPDPSDSYERSHPENEPGLGRMNRTDNTPHEQAEGHADSRDNEPRQQDLSADEIQDQGKSLDPTDSSAHGDRGDADEAEATGRRSPENQNQGRP